MSRRMSQTFAVLLGVLIATQVDLVLGQWILHGNPWEVPGGGFYNANDYQKTVVTSTGQGLNKTTIMNSSGQAVDNAVLRWSAGGLGEALVGSGPGWNSYSQVFQAAINSSGNVVGGFEVVNNLARDNGIRAFYWGPGNEFVSLASLNTAGIDYQDNAFSINNQGVMVGSSRLHTGTSVGSTHAVRWDTTVSAPITLGGLGTDATGLGYSVASHVNETGNVLGSSLKYDSTGTLIGNIGVRWDNGSTTPMELETVLIDSTVAYHTPTAFTNSNIAVGTASVRVGLVSKTHSVRWNPAGQATILDNLGTGSDGAFYSYVYGVNELGVAAGTSAKYDLNGNRIAHQAVRWNAASSQIEELLHPSFGTDVNGVSLSHARGINLRGLAVGFVNKYDSAGASDGSVGAIWLPNGQFINANVLNLVDSDGIGTWNIQSLDSIAANGWVGGTGIYTRNGTSYQRGFVARIGLGGIWVNPGTGIGIGGARWSDGDNWETGTAALTQGHARFASWGNHRIFVDESIVTNAIQIERGIVHLQLLGNRLTSREGLIIDQGAAASISSEFGIDSSNLGIFEGDIANAGTLSAGNSPGLLAVDGSLSNEGQLLFEVAGSQPADFDRIWLSGDFFAGGVLKLVLLDGYRPGAGSAFEIMRFQSFQDQGMVFDFSLAQLDSGLAWDTTQFASTGFLSISAIPEPGGLLILVGMILGSAFRSASSRRR